MGNEQTAQHEQAKNVEAKSDDKAETKKVTSQIKKVEEKAEEKKETEAERNQSIKLENVFGKEMKKDDYFYKGIVPAGFEQTCGRPVDREDLISVFHEVFDKKDNILFYKQRDKEVYLIIIPLKYSTSVGESEDSIDGDFQKHAISFLQEGSVNLDTLKKKLEKITKFVNFNKR